MSLISETLVSNTDIKTCTKKVSDASGNHIPILGEVIIRVTTPVGQFWETMLVVSKNSKVQIPLLLGINFLKRSIIDFSSGEIHFVKTQNDDYCTNTTNCYESDEGLRMNITNSIISNVNQIKHETCLLTEQNTSSDNEGKCNTEGAMTSNNGRKKTGVNPNEFNVHLLQDLELKENSVSLTKIKSPAMLRENSTIVIHTTEHRKKAVVVGNAVTKVRNGYLWVHLVNLDDKRVTLKQGTRLCEASVWSDDTEKIQALSDQVYDSEKTLRMLNLDDIDCKDSNMKEPLRQLLNKYRNVSWLENEPLGHYTGEPLSIDLKNEEVIVNKPPYRIPHSQQGQLDEEINKLLKQGVIKRSKSLFNSPLIIVSKPGNQIRPCIDFRALNKETIPITFPIPRISDLLNSIGDIKVISSLDLASAYHQCEVKSSDQHKTAFTINNTKFEYARVPFGLVSAPGYFSRVINEALIDVIGINVLVYMDDILVFSKDEKTHLERLEQVLQALAKVNLKIKINKCEFFTDSVNFLGYKLTREGMALDESRIQSLKNMPYPTNKKQLQSFLGTCNYFRQFVENFADVAEPLYKLLRKNIPYKWTSSQSEAVDKLKLKLCKSPILRYPNFSQDFYIYTDASLVGISACLMQTSDEGILHPVSYVAKSLSETQRMYSTTKRELLALTFALEQFRYLILYYPVHVYTDHKPLLGILSRTSKDACLTRWALLAQEYKIQLHYLPGKRNIFSDTLSRLVDINDMCEDLPEQLDMKLIEKLNNITHVEDENDSLRSFIPLKCPWSEAELRTAQAEDSQCIEIRKTISSSTTESTLKLSKFRILKSILYVHRIIKRANSVDEFLVPYVPETLMDKAFKTVHNDITAGHTGYDRTLKIFRKNYYNSKETELLKKLCAKCDLCVQAKGIPKLIPIGKYPIPPKPFTTLTSDILGPLPVTENGNKYIIVFRDVTTRYSIFKPLLRKDTECIIQALRQVIANYGSSEILLTDNAQEYKAEKLANFCVFYNIKKVEYAPYHASSGGLAERINRELNKLVRIYVREVATNDWDEFIPILQLTVNNTYNETIGETPFFALYGYDSPTLAFNQPKTTYREDDLTYHLKKVYQVREYVRKKLLLSQENYTTRTNSGRKSKPIQVGQRVFAKLKHYPHNKLNLPVTGPMVVIDKKGRAFKLMDTASKEEYLVHPDSIIIGLNPPKICEETDTATEEKKSPGISPTVVYDNAKRQDQPQSRYNLRGNR